MVKTQEPAVAHNRLRTGKTDLVVTASSREYEYEFVPTRPESKLARDEVNVVLQRAAGRSDLVPSRSESFGLVALEAAACGTPVVAAAVGGLTTLVDDERTGLLVEERAPAAFARAVDRLLTDPSLSAAMGHAAAAAARAYTWSVTAARLRRIYVDLTVRGLVECA